MVKEFLSHHQIEYEVKNVAEDDVARNEMVTKYDSMSTPTVVVGNEVVIGFHEERLKQLLQLD